MNVELTIQSMFDYYPTLFKERADCLSHLFVTIGNGYKWKDGELVSIDDEYNSIHIDQLKNHLINGKAFQHNKMSLRDDAIYYLNKRLQDPEYKDPYLKYFTPEEAEAHHRKYIESLPTDIYYNESNRRYRWGCCHRFNNEEYLYWSPQYIKLLNYPEDIKPDWLAAIEETKKLLKEDGLVYNG